MSFKRCQYCLQPLIDQEMDFCDGDCEDLLWEEEYEKTEPKQTRSDARRKGQTLNAMIREYNETGRSTLIDSVAPPADIAYLFKVGTEPTPEFEFVEAMGVDDYLGLTAHSEEMFDSETERLISATLVDLDPDQLSTDEPLY